MGERIFIAACLLGISYMFFYAMTNAVSLPDVYFSHATGDCVEVVNYKEGHNYTCENLPTRFYHKWVE